MKTAMQQLIEWIDYTCTPLDCVMKAKELLEEEKRQIMEAWNDGFYGLESPETQSAEQYYNQTYNNENKQDTIQ